MTFDISDQANANSAHEQQLFAWAICSETTSQMSNDISGILITSETRFKLFHFSIFSKFGNYDLRTLSD